jgi:3-phosphoshikimate 1-carboxyvinyltransferase
MDITIIPHKLSGTVFAIPSKSQAHRLLICAAFADRPTLLHCPATNQDIEATADCLRSLGAEIEYNNGCYHVTPIGNAPETATLKCRESGSTLRFMLPIVGALGVNATFIMEGRLPQRPLSPLWEEMERNGCVLARPTENTLQCRGKLLPGEYSLDGSVSSQFITGLLYAFALMHGKCNLSVTGKTESKPYIEMTRQALRTFGIAIDEFKVCGHFPFSSPGELSVEGDWSNGAFFLAAKALGSDLEIQGLCNNSAQGDRAVADILQNIGTHITVDAADIPDLVPILAVAGGANKGITFTNIGRLRLKESDRVASVAAMLGQLGAAVQIEENTMTVSPAQFHGCTIDSVGDHRIAMAAAIAATVSSGPVSILGAHCVAKSYPSFWEEYRRLGGTYEQYIR